MAEPMEPMTHPAQAPVLIGSGNVFADLDLPNPDEMVVKAKLAVAIQGTIETRRLTQKRAAELMGIDQPKVSKIIRGRLGEFSTEWLLTRILRLGLDIDIVVHTQSIAEDRLGAINVACI